MADKCRGKTFNVWCGIASFAENRRLDFKHAAFGEESADQHVQLGARMQHAPQAIAAFGAGGCRLVHGLVPWKSRSAHCRRSGNLGRAASPALSREETKGDGGNSGALITSVPFFAVTNWNGVSSLRRSGRSGLRMGPADRPHVTISMTTTPAFSPVWT